MSLEPFRLIALMVVFFFTSIISVVTGSTSLITVPVMLQFAIEPRSAIATNMFALIFMSLGGSLSFRNRNVIDNRRSPLLIILTLVSSSAGALLLLSIPSDTLPFIIAVLMIAVVMFSMFRPGLGIDADDSHVSRGMEIIGYGVTFILGIYGGFFSGGYVTLLTAAFVLFFRTTFLQAVSTTKLVNIFSSLVATAVFMWRGLVDYKLGIILGTTMLIGAFIGGRVALKLGNVWMRRIFVTAVIALALKMLLYDYFFSKLPI